MSHKHNDATEPVFLSIALSQLGHPREGDESSMICCMETFTPAETAAAPQLRERHAIPDRFKWNLAHIFSSWEAWKAAYDELDRKIGAYAALQGTLAQGPDQLLAALKLADDIGQLEYKVWYFAALK